MKMAAEQKHVRACNSLGLLYCQGTLCIHGDWINVDKDHVEAHKWFTIANNRDGIRQTKKAVIIRDKSIARKNQVDREVKNKSPEGLYLLGMASIIGTRVKCCSVKYDPLLHGIDGIDIDHKEGIKNITMSTKQGHKEAANQLGYIYGYQKLSSGTKVNVDTDMEESYKYFKIAKNTKEMSNIGTILNVENQTDELQKLEQKVELLERKQTIVPSVPSAPPSYTEANV